MRRTMIGALALVLFLVLGLSSCDQAFQANFFAKATHPEISANDLEKKSPGEIADLLASAEYKAQILDDPEKTEAILTALGEVYAAEPGTEKGQTAAILAAEVQIAGDPAAAFVSSTLLASIADLSDSEIDLDEVGPIIEGLVPADILSEIDVGSATPPGSFVSMIKAFQDANATYTVLGSNLGTDDEGVHVYEGSVKASEALPIAVNALVAGFISAIKPADWTTGDPEPTSQEVADALWTAIVDPDSAGASLQIELGVMETMLSAGSPVMNLLEAANLIFELPETGGQA